MKVITPAGNIYDIEKSPLAQILIEGGLCAVIPNATPAPPIVWSVGQDAFSGEILIVALRGNEVMHFRKADAPNQKFRGEPCPPEIAAKFREMVKLAPQQRREAIAKFAEDKRKADELARR